MGDDTWRPGWWIGEATPKVIATRVWSVPRLKPRLRSWTLVGGPWGEAVFRNRRGAHSRIALAV